MLYNKTDVKNAIKHWNLSYVNVKFTIKIKDVKNYDISEHDCKTGEDKYWKKANQTIYGGYNYKRVYKKTIKRNFLYINGKLADIYENKEGMTNHTLIKTINYYNDGIMEGKNIVLFMTGTRGVWVDEKDGDCVGCLDNGGSCPDQRCSENANGLM